MADSPSLSDLRLSPSFAVKSAPDGVIEGYASTWGGPPDSYGDVIAKGAFTRTLGERHPLMLWAHDQSRVIGKWTDLREDERGLYVKGALNLATSNGRDAFEHIRAGDVSGTSIGWRNRPGGSTKNRDGSRTLKDIDVFEISVVAIPANERARIRIASKRELQDLLHKTAGLPRAAAAKVAAGGWDALAAAGEEEPDFKAYADRIHAAAHRLRNGK